MPSRHALGRAAFVALASLFALVCLAQPAAAVERTSPQRRRTLARATPQRLAPEERRAVAMERFFRGDGVRRCWTRQLLRDPTSPSRRLTVRFQVDVEGRIAAVQVRDPAAPALAACIAATSVSVIPVGPGDAIVAEGTLTFERGE